jgi:dihydrofolate synthase/folylpolyglutamate synthase
MILMHYPEAIEFLLQRQQNGMKLGLDTMNELMERLGRPERRFPSVHIAGTNGKGSTAAMLESVLRCAGYRTGLYTSPHLVDVRERIRIDGEWISEKDMLACTVAVHRPVEDLQATYFETITAMAFHFFADRRADAVVIEVGLGGRLDATNVVRPVLTVITEIGLEHTQLLGRTLKAVAGEKAGIMKPQVPCVAGTRKTKIKAFFSRVALKTGCPLIFAADSVRISKLRMTSEGSRFYASAETSEYGDLFLGLIGAHQIDNARTVLSAVDQLRKAGWRIADSAVRLGLEKAAWRGRIELLQNRPDVLVDSAHNPAGVKTLVKAVRSLFKYRRLILVFGVLQDKNVRSMLNQLAPLAGTVILTRPDSERARDPASMSSLLCLRDKTVLVLADIAEAWCAALGAAEPDDLIIVTGSMYLVGEILNQYTAKK